MPPTEAKPLTKMMQEHAEMLAALKEMCAAFLSRNNRQAEAIDQANAVIAKAEGR